MSAALAMAAAASAPAQSVPRDTLLARLTSEALAANPSVAAASAVARAAAGRVRPAGALPDPMVSTGVTNLILPQFAFRRSDFTEIDFEAEQEFPWPGTLRARTDAAGALAISRQAEAAGRRRETSVATARVYYRLRYLASARATLARQRALLTAAVEIATARYATGTAPQSDPLQARLARAKLDLEEAPLVAQEGALAGELRALRNVTGPESVAVRPIEPAVEQLDRRHEQIMALQADATTAGHPRLALRRADIDAARAVARAEALGARPDFTVSARYGARTIAADFFSAFVGVRVPLWARLKQHRLAEAAREDAKAAEAALANEERALDAELQAVRANVAAERRRIQVLAEQVVPTADEAVEAALRSYRVGQVDFLRLLAAQEDRYRAALELAEATADHLTHLVMLEQLLRPEDES